jgi:hypothetical protein
MTTTTPPSEDHYRYDVMVQEALLGVVRKVLVETARLGLQGEHHFYITFRSEGPGVKLSARLKEKYPEEMTVVLQHQFWDLAVSEIGFEVGLSFGGVPEKLVVPFEALTGFFDPSVQFGLKFTPDEAAADNDEGDEPLAPPVKAKRPSRAKKVKDEATDESAPESAPAAAKIAGLGKNEGAGEGGSAGAGKGEGKGVSEKPADEAKPATGAEVVSLDAFRKKK